MRPFRLKALAAVLFPLLVMGGWLAQLKYDTETGLKIELPIRAYDPRDLLAGHYLTYQINYGDKGGCATDDQKHPRYNRGEAQCQCVRAGENPVYWSGACSTKPAECEYFIKGYCGYSGFRAGIERFYISERLSQERFTPGEQAKVRLSVPRSGRALVVGITR